VTPAFISNPVRFYQYPAVYRAIKKAISSLRKAHFKYFRISGLEEKILSKVSAIEVVGFDGSSPLMKISVMNC
jgi:predicted nuclease with RNAse H fold